MSASRKLNPKTVASADIARFPTKSVALHENAKISIRIAEDQRAMDRIWADERLRDDLLESGLFDDHIDEIRDEIIDEESSGREEFETRVREEVTEELEDELEKDKYVLGLRERAERAEDKIEKLDAELSRMRAKARLWDLNRERASLLPKKGSRKEYHEVIKLERELKEALEKITQLEEKLEKTK